MTKSMKRIQSVTIKHIGDSDPDTSYLEQDEFKERLRQYRNGLFCYCGIRAEAEITIPTGTFSSERMGGQEHMLMQTITSGGLWGIESDSGAAYLKEIEDEQLSELRDQLHAIGFSQRAISASFKDILRNDE